MPFQPYRVSSRTSLDLKVRKQDTVIIKYNAGNIQSVLFALDRMGVNALVTDDKDRIMDADKVIFPGVGEARSAMHYLREKGLDELIVSLKQPVLGICLGMQLMCRYSEENDTDCLGIFDEEVQRFDVKATALKVPQIGWNTIGDLKTRLFEGIPDPSYCYFVHGYFAARGADTIAVTDHAGLYSAALHRDNFFGVQFHPEKSATVGARILENFLNY
jgi:glutamine amidotransferase